MKTKESSNLCWEAKTSPVKLLRTPDNFDIQNITYVKNPLASQRAEAKWYDVFLELKSKQGNTATFTFGGLTIIESMTHLIQKKHFGEKTASKFPYRAAIEVAAHVSPRIAKNEEMVFALCDVALLSSNPGMSFNDIAREIELRDINVITGEDIYKFGLSYYREVGYHFEQRFENAKNALLGISGQLFGHEVFIDNKIWLHTVIKAGYYYRLQNPHFMLDLYRDKASFSVGLATLYKVLGTPDIINLDNHKWIELPKGLEADAKKVSPVFLTAFAQLQDSLLYGTYKCSLLDNCKASSNKMPIDDHCNKSPWEKGNITPFCPVGALMAAFGLNQKTFSLKGGA